ncbi:MAG: nucleoside monophosphate kinase [Patescibacteria group bacterium]|nr:nucleoside monophosphate kinase [Patescibacteria group bacterium]
MIYIVLGPSGCGKGTQAKLLAAKIDVPSFSTGELIREGADRGDSDALKAKEIADRGVWSPNEIVNKILSQALEETDLKKGFVLDGFPRNPEQAIWLDDFLSARDSGVSKVIHLETTLEESLRRIKGRIANDAKLGRVRSDETEEAIKGRFESYSKTIQPIKDYYQKQGKLVLVNNLQPIAAVQDEIRQKLGITP